jgi:hypothetical protein
MEKEHSLPQLLQMFSLTNYWQNQNVAELVTKLFCLSLNISLVLWPDKEMNQVVIFVHSLSVH